MPEFHLDGVAVAAQPGESVLAACQRQGVTLATVCKGRGICGACRVVVEAGFSLLPPAGANEIRLLEYLGRGQEGAFRLACQITLAADCAGLRLSAAPILRNITKETTT